MRDKKQRRKIPTGRSVSDFWLFGFVSWALISFFDARFWDLLFFQCHGSWQLFPESVGWRQLGGMEKREKHRRRERLYLEAPVSLHQYPGMMPPLWPAKSRTQHPGCIQGDQDQGHPDVWYESHIGYLGFSFPGGICFAAIILLWVVCDDWPALHRWCEANGKRGMSTLLWRRRRWRKKATGDCVFAKVSTTALQFIEDMNVFLLLLEACSHRDSNFVPSCFCIICLGAGWRSALFLRFLLTLQSFWG